MDIYCTLKLIDRFLIIDHSISKQYFSNFNTRQLKFVLKRVFKILEDIEKYFEIGYM